MMFIADAPVLYVEDEPLIRELVATGLEDAGFHVIAAASGDAAFHALDDTIDPFFAVLTDVNLGLGPDGWEVARHARELNHILPVVYVSGASSHEWRSKGVLNSVMILKPFTLPQIVGVICSFLKKGDPDEG